jgi:hypothetical protein
MNTQKAETKQGDAAMLREWLDAGLPKRARQTVLATHTVVQP